MRGFKLEKECDGKSHICGSYLSGPIVVVIIGEVDTTKYSFKISDICIYGSTAVGLFVLSRSSIAKLVFLP